MLNGGGGNDGLSGNGGVDCLLGGSGDDVLNGGHDHLRDLMLGGTGRDTLVDHLHRRLTWDPLTGTFVGIWSSKDNLADYNSLVDRVITQRWGDA